MQLQTPKQNPKQVLDSLPIGRMKSLFARLFLPLTAVSKSSAQRTEKGKSKS